MLSLIRDDFEVRFLSTGSYQLEVPENHKLNEIFGTLELEDRDEIKNKQPIFKIPTEDSKIFNIHPDVNSSNNGVFTLKQVMYSLHSWNDRTHVFTMLPMSPSS